MGLTVWNSDWDSLTLKDLMIVPEIPTFALEQYFERAVHNLKQQEMFIQVVGNELEKRMNNEN